MTRPPGKAGVVQALNPSQGKVNLYQRLNLSQPTFPSLRAGGMCLLKGWRRRCDESLIEHLPSIQTLRVRRRRGRGIPFPLASWGWRGGCVPKCVQCRGVFLSEPAAPSGAPPYPEGQRLFLSQLCRAKP